MNAVINFDQKDLIRSKNNGNFQIKKTIHIPVNVDEY